MAANVSIDALVNVAAALNNFQIDMKSFSGKIYNCIGEAENQCRSVIRRLEEQIEKLKDDISLLGYKAADCKRRMDNCEMSISRLEGLISELESENASYEAQKMPLSSASDPEDYYMIEAHNSELDGKIAYNNSSIEKYKNEIMEEEKEWAKAEWELRETERQLDQLKAEKDKKEDLKGRLNQKFYIVETELDNLHQASKQFCRNALDEADGNISGISRCIQYVNEYTSTNL